MALFFGRDRTGANADFKGDGSASAFILAVAANTARPTSVGAHQSQDVSTAAGLQTIPAGATHALVSVDAAETSGIRFTEDGTTAASATEGHEISPGSAVELAIKPLSSVSVCAVAGTVTIQISYRRYDVAE